MKKALADFWNDVTQRVVEHSKYYSFSHHTTQLDVSHSKYYSFSHHTTQLDVSHSKYYSFSHHTTLLGPPSEDGPRRVQGHHRTVRPFVVGVLVRTSPHSNAVCCWGFSKDLTAQ